MNMLSLEKGCCCADVYARKCFRKMLYLDVIILFGWDRFRNVNACKTRVFVYLLLSGLFTAKKVIQILRNLVT